MKQPKFKIGDRVKWQYAGIHQIGIWPQNNWEEYYGNKTYIVKGCREILVGYPVLDTIFEYFLKEETNKITDNTILLEPQLQLIKTMNPPINIFSGSSDELGATLTFPTCLSFKKGKIKQQYPVKDKKGNVYPDAEAAYQMLKEKAQNNLDLYIKIAVAKFRQYPELSKQIEERGGLSWLEICEHKTYAKSRTFQWWEGEGRRSPMIDCLCKAYEIYINENKSRSPAE